MTAFNKAVRGARRMGATLLEPDPEPGDDTPPEPTEPTVTEERRRITRVARHQYAEQLIPWKVLGGATVAGLWVNNADWSPFGALAWSTFLAFGFYVFTEYRLTWRHTGRGHVEFRRPTGGQQRRIRERAIRAAWCGGWIGMWLVAVTVTTPGTLPGTVVWLLGAAAWATVSYHGWWGPAGNVIDAEFTLALSHPDDNATPDGPVTPTAGTPARRPSPRPAAVVPISRAAQMSGVPATGVPAELPHPRVSLPDANLLVRKADPGKIPPGEDLTDTVNQLFREHKVRAAVVEAVRSPRVTRYGVRPEAGERVQKILNMQKDIAMRCKTGTVRVLAPIEGRDLVGIEVPNTTPDPVTVGEVLACIEAQRDTHPLLFALGKDTDGNYQLGNLAKMPHLLLAGGTGGGKSGGLNAFLASILSRALPDEVRLILIDTKKVELSRYTGIPHLAMQVVTDAHVAIDALAYAVREAERRYSLMAANGVRHIDDFNTGILNGTITTPRGSRETLHTLPYWVVIIDELADLMGLGGEKIEEHIVRLGQIARAAGVHLVVATQRPAVEVVTNKIKANVPARIAYKTSSGADSRTIIDKADAAHLTGRGDMLYKRPDHEILVRIQGGWVSDKELDTLVAYWRSEAAAAGLTIPDVMLAIDADDQEQSAGPVRLTARDVVLAAAQRHADDNGEVTRDAIVAATPTVGKKSRDAALTQLKVRGLLASDKQGIYRVIVDGAGSPTPAPVYPIEQEAEDQ